MLEEPLELPKIGAPSHIDLKIWTPQEIGADCVINITWETDARGFPIRATNPVRTLHPGDRITFTGGNDVEYYLRINGKKVAIPQSEIENLRVFLE